MKKTITTIAALTLSVALAFAESNNLALGETINPAIKAIQLTVDNETGMSFDYGISTLDNLIPPNLAINGILPVGISHLTFITLDKTFSYASFGMIGKRKDAKSFQFGLNASYEPGNKHLNYKCISDATFFMTCNAPLLSDGVYNLIVKLI